MAGLALAREAQPLVVGVARRGVVREVARHALGRRVHVLARLLPAVAGLAVEPRVRREEREARAVVHAEEALPRAPGLRQVAGVALRRRARRGAASRWQSAQAVPTCENTRLWWQSRQRRLAVRGHEREARALVVERERVLERPPALGRVAGASTRPRARRAGCGVASWECTHEERRQQERDAGSEPSAERDASAARPIPLRHGAPEGTPHDSRRTRGRSSVPNGLARRLVRR